MYPPVYPPATPNTQVARQPGETDAAYYARVKQPPPLAGESDAVYLARIAALPAPIDPGGHGYRF
jgi:Arc/MetJ family transcription regulator